MSGTHVIVGPPGTGKTETVARQAHRAADAYGATSVLIASLTRTAAHEIATRVEDLPEGNVGTLHALAYRALGKPPLAETPESIETWNTEHPGRTLPAGAKADPESDAPAEQTWGGAGSVHQQLAVLRARRVDRAHWPAIVSEHHARWETFKRRHGLLDFADLIDRAAARGTHPEKPRGLFFDEAQDFSAAEWRLVQAWAGGAQTTVVVGDFDQSAYAWRGADPHALERLDLTGIRILAQSHRVPHAVHATAKAWIDAMPGRTPVDYMPSGRTCKGGLDGAPCERCQGDRTGRVARLHGHLQAPEAWLHEVEQRTNQGRTVMVLATCGYMLEPLLAVLRRRAIPFANPHRPGHSAWNPLKCAGALRAFLAPDADVWGDQARAWTWNDLGAWIEPIDAKKALARGGKELVRAHLKAGDGTLTVPPADTGHILGTDTIDHPALRLDTSWWQQMLRPGRAKRHAFSVDVWRRRGGRALSEPPRLLVGTCHSFKGSEASCCILAPDLSREGYWHGWRAKGEGRDAVRRLMYVGATRARDELLLLDPAGAEHVRIGGAG